MLASLARRFHTVRQIARTAAAGATAAVAAAGAPAHAAETWPAQVEATYKIHFSGLELGDFTFNSRTQQNSYSASSNALISAMFGAFEWKGQSQSSGTTSEAGPKPATYTFNFKNQSKTGFVNMAFAGNAVTNVSAVPPIEKKPGTIELKDIHLKDVLDPLSAVMALSRPQAAGKVAGVNPCNRRMPIFDGKQRFDLEFRFKRMAPLSEVGAKSPHTAFVCRVKYIPIAGYRMNEDMRQMTQATGIEVWMVPIADANVFVPYYVSVPVSAGTATLTAARVNIDTGRGRVALH